MGTTFLDWVASQNANTGVGFGKAARLLAVAWQVRKERNALASLDARALADIGVHHNHADRESRRKFFDVPQSRLPRD